MAQIIGKRFNSQISGKRFISSDSFSRRKVRRIVRIALALCAVACICLLCFTASRYRAHAATIDERLARGYTHASHGIYAAPRVLLPNRPMTIRQLAAHLRAADYVEGSAGEIWNGSFTIEDNALVIRPRPRHSLAEQMKGFTEEFTEDFAEVRIAFADGRIAEITGNGGALASYTLAPELLTKNASLKTNARAALAFSDLPAPLVNAILAVEDRRFFEHTGIDPRGVLRALWHNLLAAEDHGARRGQGGSTITQQLVKNTYLTHERTLRRKFDEALIALALENRLTKKEIFALYCNEIHLGTRGAVIVRGVGQAARIFFDKDVRDVTIGEAAILAGMIQSPRRYAPDRYPEAARARRRNVLGMMAEANFITYDEARLAHAEAINIANLKPTHTPRAAYFLDYVNRDYVNHRTAPHTLSDKVDDAPARIHTTLDLDLQALAEEALTHGLEQLENKHANENKHVKENKHTKFAVPQGALVALDPQTGRVLAMVGGADYAASQLNRAIDARRQPGSVFKPFVYAAALEQNISPLSRYRDAQREFTYANNARYRPANYGGSYSNSDITMREALIHSKNVVAVDVALRTGLEHVKEVAARFGLPQAATAYPSLALGANDATPLELAAAYAVFANGGRSVRPSFMRDIGGNDFADQSPAGKQIIAPEIAFAMTDMMRGVIERGTARAAKRELPANVAFAGKTGTSRDGWFVGYTPNLVCAVFVGYDDNNDLKITGGDSALPIWTRFMREVIALRPELGGRNFPRPEGITFAEVDRETGMLASGACPHRDQVALSIAAFAASPQVVCQLHSRIEEEYALHAAPLTEHEDDDTALLAVNATNADAGEAVSVSIEENRPTPRTSALRRTPAMRGVAPHRIADRSTAPTTKSATHNGRTMLVNELRSIIP